MHVDQEGRIDLNDLIDRLVDDPDCGALATELAVREDPIEDVPAHVKACLQGLERKYADQNVRDLIAKLKVAERAGRWEEARALNRQINEWRIRKAGVPAAGAVSMVKE
jgi:DNA primase